MARKFGLKSDKGSIYNNYSIVYSILGQLELSIDYCMKALDIFTELEDSVRIAQ